MLIPALLLALLLALSGCGGGSDDPQAQSTAASSSEEAKSKGQAPTTESEGEKSAEPTGSSSAPSTAASGAKHGPHVTPPKGQPEQAPSAEEKENSAVATMALEAPSFQAVGGEYEIPTENTCEGKGTSPELRWSGVPSGTAELILFVINLEPVDEALFFDWAVAGVDPSLQGLEAGQLPKGAIQGQNSFGEEGYKVCPQGAGPETYIFALYALPQSLSAQRGFDPTELREEVLEASGNVGLMAAVYGRG